MILNRLGEEFYYENNYYHVGDQIVGTSESEYEGLYGVITEIRDAEDQETENETPDIYCTFEPPVLPCEIKQLEEIFSNLYGMPKTLKDISLDFVIMAPEMLRVIDQVAEPVPERKVYMVTEDWADDNNYGSFLSAVYTEFDDAKRKMVQMLLKEQTDGTIASWKENNSFVEESTPTSYECYLEGEYCESHYHVEIMEQSICSSPSFMRGMSDAHTASCQLEDFASQISDWDELVHLSGEQIERMTHDPRFPGRFQKALGNNDYYWESYWLTMSEVAKEFVNLYLNENATKENVPMTIKCELELNRGWVYGNGTAHEPTAERNFVINRDYFLSIFPVLFSDENDIDLFLEVYEPESDGEKIYRQALEDGQLLDEFESVVEE